MKKFTKGFTLIELLVVIAIIGILSSVVLASLNTARSKGSDAAVKSNLTNMRSQAELLYDGDYDAVCGVSGVGGDATVIAAMASAVNAGSTGVTCSEPGTTGAASWAISAKLPSNAASYFCVDSTGKATTTASAASAGLCP